MKRLIPVLLALLPGLFSHAAKAQNFSGMNEICALAARQAERARHIPDQFLAAMGRVESGRNMPDGSGFGAWPWTINVQGKSYFFDSKQEAIAAVKDFQDKGARSIDVGCLQVNLLQHPDAFSSLEAAFDPLTNAMFAAGFLVDLFGKTGSWPRAAAAYHSFTPEIGSVYQWKVLESWAMPSAPSTGNIPQHARPPMPTAPSAIFPSSGDNSNVSTMTSSAPHATMPFTGGYHGFNTPASHPRIHSTINGRTLAAYRANPVRIPVASVIIPARF